MADKERPWWQHRNAPKPGDDLRRTPPPPRPKPPTPPQGENRGDQDWWQDRRVPRPWQEEPPRRLPPNPRQKPQQRGEGSADAYETATPQEKDRMLRGAFQAGMNGDDGAMQSFPNTPFGQRLRQEFMRGRQQRQKPNRGLGFSQMDRS